MKQVLSVEAKKLNKLGIVMVASFAVAAAWIVITMLLDLSLAAIAVPAAILFVPAVVSATLAERIKHDNQLFTYQAVEAFMQGEDPQVLTERNQRAGRIWWGKLALKTVAAIIIGFCCGWGLISILSTIFV